MRFSKEFFLKLGTGKFLLLLLMAIFQISAVAQHCPFDGGRMIIVHVTDPRGRSVTSEPKKLTLVEVNNPVASSCTYAEGLLAKTLLPTKQELQTHYESYWEQLIKPHYEGWSFYNDGYYAVILNMSENSCMLKKGNDFEYRPREFEIKLDGFGTLPNVKVKKEDFFHLCTDGGSWKRIKPVEIRIPRNIRTKNLGE